MGRLSLRAAVVLALAVAASPSALADPGHSRLLPLPSVLPPAPLHRQMRWSVASARPPSAAAFAAGHATIGLAGRSDGRALATEFGLHALDWLPGLRLLEVSGTPSVLAALARADNPGIRYVEPLVAGQTAHVRNDPLTYELDPATGVPYEWQFHAIGADQALNIAKGDPGLLVGVVDSGVAPVPDLAGKVAETFWDPAFNSSASDRLGHGTFVSSIIASRNDDGFGLAGFCGACRLAVYKAEPLTDVQVAEGIQKLTDAHVRVINLSVVLDHPAQDVIDAINYATTAGVLVVAASGNEGSTAVDFPASLLQPPNGAPSSGLAIGASDAKGAPASFSNGGPQLSLIAPGTFNTKCTVGILGAIPASAPAFGDRDSCSVTMSHADGARYAYASGTSFSAPEVAGVAALVWSLKPSLTSTQVAAVLEQTATRPAGTGWNATAGWGVLNAKAAVENVSGKSTADSIVLAQLRLSRPRTPGSRIEAQLEASWGDGSAISVGATPSCRITVAGSAVLVSSTLDAGHLTCAFTVPRRSAGAQVLGALALTAAGAPTATASFRFAVPRQS